MLKVTDVDYVKDYELLLTFNDGTRKLCDLKPYLTARLFEKLSDPKTGLYFQSSGYVYSYLEEELDKEIEAQ